MLLRGASKPVLAPPVAVGKYVVFTVSDNTIIALDSETGSDFWDQPLKIDDGISSPAVATVARDPDAWSQICGAASSVPRNATPSASRRDRKACAGGSAPAP